MNGRLGNFSSSKNPNRSPNPLKLMAAAKAKTPSRVKSVGEAKLPKASDGGASPINRLISTAIRGGTNSSSRLKAHRTTVITKITPNKAIAVA